MTLDTAKELIRQGWRFGEVYTQLENEQHKQSLKDWYVRESGVPNLQARGEAVIETSESVGSKNGKPVSIVRAMGYTGSFCRKCQGSRMVRTGTCERCEDCGDTNGGCG